MQVKNYGVETDYLYPMQSATGSSDQQPFLWWRYFFHIAYKGIHYHGWQSQKDIVNVQYVIEKALSEILKVPCTIMGCGRTDAQVHASQYFFHLDVEKKWDFDLLFRLNKKLPSDIAVFEIIPMEGSNHARFDASQRTYDYFIHTYKDPFLSGLSALYPERNPDLHKIKAALSLLTRYQDYRAFCKTPDTYKNTICKVTAANLYTDTAGDRIRFEFSSNRFLTRMIRILVDKLLDVGNGILSVDEFESHLITREAPKTIEPAYPQGLYLSRVIYPYLDVAPRADFSARLHHEDQWLIV